MPLSAPELTSPIFEDTADAVNGGLMSSSESVVVCDFSSVVLDLRSERGSLISGDEDDGDDETLLLLWLVGAASDEA